MIARIEFTFFKFNYESHDFSIEYKLFENKKFLFTEIEVINLPQFNRALDCLEWLKNNFYQFYQLIDLEIPFELIDFKFQRSLKSMGINAYEF